VTRRALWRLLDILPAFAVLAAGVGLWETWVRVRGTPGYVLPPPSQIWEAFTDDRGLVWHHLLMTVGEAALGLVAGTAIVVASQTVPMIILAPLLVLWFGYGLTPKVVVVGLVTFFPVAISTTGGLTGAPPEQIELIKSMGATSRDVLRRVRVPYALPALFDGLRIAAAYTVAGAVIAEWTGASRGLGIYISRAQASFRVDRVFVAVVVVALLSTALFLLIGGVARLACPWYFRRRIGDSPASTPERTAS